MMKNNPFLPDTVRRKHVEPTFKKAYKILFILGFFAIAPVSPVFAFMQEQQDVLDLVPVKAVDREVVKSGAWSNPSSLEWRTPAGRRAKMYMSLKTNPSWWTIDSDASLNTIRVDGKIDFGGRKSVKLKVDTLVVTETGTFKIGSESAPVPSDNKVEIIIANNGPIIRKWDPSNISRGVILQGKTEISGTEKSAYPRTVRHARHRRQPNQTKRYT